ncbi:MAG TPA: sensor protein Chase2, partial [Cyanobacteria bacterium UBA11049]|nr:sensor protein Chase2 [Cyanobacteria bacterium UBA11049]
FAGHSETDGETGRIYINQFDSLSVNELKYGLKKAIAGGLQLAIFNSCDGLGLARELSDLQIPEVVLMREPVPDRVAQEFLKNFLKAFSLGKSLYLSVREARERLQGWESEFPCASWLPVIYQNPSAKPPLWQEWLKRDRPKNKPRLRNVLLSSLAVTAGVMGVRFLGMLQGVELQAYDRLMQLRPEEKPDPRLLVVTVNERDFQLPEQKDRKGSLSDLALERLLQKLDKFKPRAIGLDIYRDFPVGENTPALTTQMRQNNSFYAVCKVSDPEFDPDGVQPPPEMPRNRLGFSDLVDDGDSNTIRRQYIHLDPPLTSRCGAKYAFSLKLALHYLDTKGIESNVTSEGNLQIRNVIFQRLQPHSGAYQSLDTSRGYQLMINYRPFRSLEDIAPQVTLEQVLKDRIPPDRVKDLQGRIVLIGPTAPSFGDYWSTPYNMGQQPLKKQIPGVFLQAQMVSQILSAVLDGRSLIWVMPVWGEALWILAWAMLGGLLALRLRSPLYLGITLSAALVILYGICFGILTKGGWLPLVPSALALAATSGIVVISVRSRSIALPEGI